MSSEIAALIERARVAADRPDAGGSTRAAERQRLERLASEFESMLLVQVLRDMRRAGTWNEGESETAGETQSLFELLDAELATQMTRVQGFGMTRQLLEAFDRMKPAQPEGDGLALAGATEGAGPIDVAAPVDVATRALAALPGGPHGGGVVTSSSITSPYGWRRDPITGDSRFHRGVDLKAAYGQDVPAAAGGRVLFSGSQGSYGTTVVVEHQDRSRTRYAHLSVALVEAGDEVSRGDLIGRAGSTGRATGPHVHVEVVDVDGNSVDPAGSW